jgi:phosphoglycolate phosphatase
VLHGIRLVIYDLDGTLIDSTEAIVETFNRVIEEQDEPSCPKEEIEEMIGLPLTEMFLRVLPAKKHGEIQSCWDRYVEIYSDIGPRKTRILPGVPQTLLYFKDAGFLQSIATTKRGDVASRLLRTLHLRCYFELVLGINDVASPKPAPDIIEETLKRIGVKPKEAVFVEDTTIGLEAGIRAGIHTVGITTGTHDREKLLTLHPDYIIDELPELRYLLSC